MSPPLLALAHTVSVTPLLGSYIIHCATCRVRGFSVSFGDIHQLYIRTFVTYVDVGNATTSPIVLLY